MSSSPIGRVNRLFNDARVRRVLLKGRLPLGLVAVAVLLLNVKREWFAAGLAVSAFGALAQLWCFSCIRTQQELASSGPYTLVRNPMYLTRYFLVAGAVLMTGWWLAAAALTLAYWFYMANRVSREEAKLRRIFGEPYVRYCERVNRFVPSFRNVDWRGLTRCRWDCFQRNHGVVNAVAVLCFYAAAWWFAFGRMAKSN